MAIYFDGQGSIKDSIFWGNKAVLGIHRRHPDVMALDVEVVGGPENFRPHTTRHFNWLTPGKPPAPCPPGHALTSRIQGWSRDPASFCVQSRDFSPPDRAASRSGGPCGQGRRGRAATPRR